MDAFSSVVNAEKYLVIFFIRVIVDLAVVLISHLGGLESPCFLKKGSSREQIDYD